MSFRVVSQIETGKIHVYTGDGKGKTTAAFGLAMRARGKGLNVIIIQFLKGKGDFGEVLSARKLGIEIEQFGTGKMLAANGITEEDRKEALAALERAAKVITSGLFDIVVLDEINVAVYFGLIPLKSVIEMIRSRPATLELVLTGRGAPAELVTIADYATNMTLIKHPYERGEEARPGIEY